MAGGKETPRQKMIGIMYLVLLALLALQVGAEIMVKFAQLNDSLSLFVEDSIEKSDALLANISEKVAERGNKPEEKKALNLAKTLHDRSEAIINDIERVKNEIIDATDGYNIEGDSTSGYKGMKDTDKTSAILVGQADKKDGYAYTLKDSLDNYIDFVNKVYVQVETVVTGLPADSIENDHFPYMAHDGVDDPLLSKTEGAKTKDFAHLNFDHTPMIASLAFLTEKQSKIAAYEKEILARLKQSVGASDFKFDEVFAMALPQSNTVAAGTYYEAQMFISASSSAITPKMEFGGSSIPVDAQGRGTVKFKVSGGNYNKDGRVEKTWTGKITIKKPTGSGDTTFVLNQPYTVTKPVIQVQSGSVSALYYNCGNDLKVLVPALGAEYNPSFSVSGGSSRKGAVKGDVTIVPKSKSVKLTVSSGGMVIGSETFNVKPIPKPEIVPIIKGREVTGQMLKNGVAPPRSIGLKVNPDPSFAGFLPNDARYYIEDWEAILVRGKRPILPPKRIRGESRVNTGQPAKTSDFAGKAKDGDRIIIEVKKITRKNFQGSKEEVNMGGPTIFVIPISI